MDKKIILEDLRKVVNIHSLEKGTPDYVLAEYLYRCLKAYTMASNKYRAQRKYYHV